MGLECGGGKLEVYELWGMDVGVPRSIPRSFKRILPYPKKAQAKHQDEIRAHTSHLRKFGSQGRQIRKFTLMIFTSAIQS